MLNRRSVGALGAGVCFGLAAVCAVFLLASIHSLTLEHVLASQYSFGAFILIAAGVGSLLVYRSGNPQVSGNVSSEKKSKPLKVDSSEALSYKTFPAGCKVMESNGSVHNFEQEIILYLPKDYVEVRASEDSTEAKKEDEDPIFGE